MTGRPRRPLVAAALAVALGLGACAGTEMASGSETDDAEATGEATTGAATSSAAATEASTSTTTDDGSTSMSTTTATTTTTTTTSTVTSAGSTVTTASTTGDSDSDTEGSSTTGLTCPLDGPSFAAEIFPIIEARCGCHKVSYPDADTAYASFVDAPSKGVPALILVQPCDVAGSYLLNKLRDTQLEVGGLGTQMPPDKALSPAQLDLFDAWVAGGAPP
ncbi:MAG: hypothetical protein KC486_03955 [Myxococcales bacterium]|nr:hypothetical protein [Myxococcales bacterium]